MSCRVPVLGYANKARKVHSRYRYVVWIVLYNDLSKTYLLTALRKTMVKAHRQAWAWQDEWCGLTMEDIREIEKQTQLALQKKMGRESEDANEKGE